MANSTQRYAVTQDDALIAWFAGIAICIHLLEAAFPSPLPGIKPGLANVVTIIVLLRYGPRFAIWVSLLRVLVGSILFGTFLTPTFMLSAAGALGSMLAMLLLYGAQRMVQTYTAKPLLSALGFALIGSIAHLFSQLLCAWGVLIMHDGILRLAPILLTAALIFGTVTGVIANAILAKLPPKNVEATRDTSP